MLRARDEIPLDNVWHGTDLIGTLHMQFHLFGHIWEMSVDGRGYYVLQKFKEHLSI